jgi:hypothetical protein
MGVLRFVLLDGLESTFYCGGFVVGGRTVR